MSKTLSEWLAEHQVSQKVFAARVGMHQSSIARTAAGLQYPRPAKRRRILEETGYEVDVYEDHPAAVIAIPQNAVRAASPATKKVG